MNRLSLAGKPLVIGLGAVLTGGAEEPAESLTAEVLPAAEVARAQASGHASPPPNPPDAGAVRVPLSRLQGMIREILDPLALPARPVKEWRGLYKSFFDFFAPEGGADEAERSAWAVAAEVFNTNLVAVCNRMSRVVPMTFQDFRDGVDSFRHDGLREGAHRDIAWQPKKILLLMAAMIGRVVAGRQADLALPQGLRPDLFAFRNHLIDANRAASFLGSVFDYDPRFSVLEYTAAGLRPWLRSFPHFACALMENGLHRCEFCPPVTAGNPPLLRVSFRRPLRVPSPARSIATFHLVLLHEAPSPSEGNGSADGLSSYFEYSGPALEALAFEASEPGEVKCAKTKRLFDLAVKDRLLVCGPHRAGAAAAARLGAMLGRTEAERFVIERFFALGFRNGHGNEPWLDSAAGEPPALDPDHVKKALKQFGQWQETVSFFLKAGQPEAAEVPGARLRQETLQARGSACFLRLLNTRAYAPVMSVFLAADAQRGWLVDAIDLHASARSLSGEAAKVLEEGAAALLRCADSFEDPRTKGIFLFQGAAGILIGLAGAHNNPRRMANLQPALAALRGHYEKQLAVTLPARPSLWPSAFAGSGTRLQDTRRKLEEAEGRMLDLVREPLGARVSGQMREILATLPTPEGHAAEQPPPRIRLESITSFEESLAALCRWVRSLHKPAPGPGLLPGTQRLAELIELRSLAEQGRAAEALDQALSLRPALSEGQVRALGPLFGQLSGAWLAAIEQKLDQGARDEAATLSQRVIGLIQGTPGQEEFQGLLRELFAPRPGEGAPAPAVPSVQPAVQGARRESARQAEELLRDYADELSLDGNTLEREFLQAIVAGSGDAFKRKEKLRRRLEKRTQWGGREPYRTTLKLLASAIESDAG